MHARWLVAALAFWPLAVGAQEAGVADLSDFTVEKTQDIVDLCSVDPGNPLYAEAKQFCYGFMTGIAHFHDALAAGPDGFRIVCPNEEVTREQFVAIFLDWAKANPDEVQSNMPAEAVVRAAVDKWGSCPQRQ